MPTLLSASWRSEYGQLEVKLRTGDMVLSFSDAVTESEDGNGRQLGSAGILRLAPTCS